MAKKARAVWVNDTRPCPKIEGNLEISRYQEGLSIWGDPDGLRSFGRLLLWLAEVDQERLASQPDGARYHVHLWAQSAPGFNSLTPFSEDTIVGRLDAKGTGEFPEKYRKARPRKTKKVEGKTTKATPKLRKRKGN